MSDLIDEHAQFLRAASRSELTIASRVRLLWVLHRQLEHGLALASTSELNAFLAAPGRAGRKRKRATLATYAMHIREFFRWADAAGRLYGDPSVQMAHPEPPQFKPRPCTPEARDLVLSAAPEPWRTAFTLAYYAGMRAGEIA